MARGLGRWKLVAGLSTLSLALATVAYGGAQRMEQSAASDRPCSGRIGVPVWQTQARVGFLPTGFGVDYDRAVARMVRRNHALEDRQTALFFAERAGAPACVIARMRRQVATLERAYANAGAAMSRALQRATTRSAGERR